MIRFQIHLNQKVSIISFLLCILEKRLSLRTILSTKNIKSYLSNEDFITKALEHLPESQRSTEDFNKTISSPQFQDALSSLTSALNSENFNLILSSFGFDLKNLKVEYGVKGLINCMIEKYSKK